LYGVNEDKPGFIGKLGTMLGDAKINIASFALGSSAPGEDAIALVEVDGGVDDKTLTGIQKLPPVKMSGGLAVGSAFCMWFFAPAAFGIRRAGGATNAAPLSTAEQDLDSGTRAAA